MEHMLDNTKAWQESSRKKTRASVRSVRYAVRGSLAELGRLEEALLEENPRSSAGIRLAGLRAELRRLEFGLPLRSESILHVLTGLRPIIPLRQPPTAPMPAVEVATMGQPV